MSLPFDLAWLLSLDVAASIVLVLALLVVRAVAGHAIRSRTGAAPHVQRRWTADLRNLLLFLGIVGLILIWAPQLQTFALSLTAVAVAVVVATKELILCFSGSFLLASTRAYKVGDWIEIGGVRGEVVDINVLATTLQEFEPSPSFVPTGRLVTVPNSLLLGTPLRNNTALRDHVQHRFAVTLEPSAEVFAHRDVIEDVISERYAPFRSSAAEAFAALRQRVGVDLPDGQVRIRLRTTDIGKHQIEVTLFCPPTAAEILENEITSALMARLPMVREGGAT